MRRNAFPVMEWTIGHDGRSNSSEKFNELVEVIHGHLVNIRLGDDLHSHAQLIMAQLAHRHGLVPFAKGEK